MVEERAIKAALECINHLYSHAKNTDQMQHDLAEIIERHYRAAQTPGKTCPTCGSDDRSKRYYDAYHRIDCTHPWHSPAPAPQKDGTIRPHCMGTEFPKK